MAVALHVGEGAFGAIDWQFVKIRRAQAAELGIEIGKQAPLQKRIFTEVDAWNNMAGAKRDLLGFGEEVVGIPVQDHLAYHFDGH